MKKTLIALAAVAATGAAFAQSSVTLYGVADISVGSVNEVVSTGTAKDGKATTGLGVASDKFQALANGTFNNGNSRWGIRGVEDLGGGLKAGFNFEQNVSLADGSTPDGFARMANMSLMGGFGEVRLGRSLNTSFYSVTAWELTGAANYSAVAKQFGFAGAGSRDNAAIMYFSPDMGGFKVGASTVLEGNSSLPTAAAPEAKYDLSLTYANGPLAASLAYNTQKDVANGMALGGKYNFGAFTLAASYHDSENELFGTKVKGYSVGGTANLGPVAVTLDIARDTEQKDTDWVLEAKYPLSKRTFVYGVVVRDGKNDFINAAGVPTGALTAKNATGYAVGIRHNF